MGRSNRESFKKGLGLEMKKPSVMFIAGTLGQGGAEKQLFLLARSLKKHGHTFTVASLTEGEYWEKRLMDEGVEVFSNKRFTSRIGKLFWLWTTYKDLRSNVIYSFHFYTSIYAGILRFLSFGKVITIGSIRNDGYSEIKANGKWSYWQMRLNHIIIANNEHGRQAVIEKLGVKEDRIFILRNALEVPIYKKREQSIEGSLKLLFVGRLVPAKDPMLFLQICSDLKHQGFQFTADIIGDGPLKDEMQVFIQTNQLDDFVRLKGKVPDAASFFPCFDLLISTSLHEGTPNVILEGLQAGCLIVSRSFNGIKELLMEVSPQYGNLIWDEAEEAVKMIKEVAESIPEFSDLRDKGRDWVSAKYSLDKQYEQFLQIVKRC